jgi:2,5-diketo-D-gluconate reductase A
VAQVVLRWLIQREVAAIPKSVRKDRIEENFDVFDFELSSDEMTAIAAMDTETSLFFDHRDPDQVGRLGTARLDI